MFNDNYRIVGKHATYAKFLNAYTRNLDKEAKVAGIFSIAVELYLIAPLIGASYNRRVPIDTESDDSLNVLAEQILKRQKQFEDVYRIIMLSEKSTESSADERVERAFRDDENPEKMTSNMELFHDYMRGGIEWLYEQVTEEVNIATATPDDYLEKIRDIVTLFGDDFELETQ